MTMSRESIRQQMQEQRSTRKRQLYEVAPSPPKKLRCPADSPSSSPYKGPLRDNSDDETPPTFRAKSFYGSKKKLVLPKSTTSTDSENSIQSSPAVVRSRNVRSLSNVSSTNPAREMTRSRVVLSPIKNVYHTVKRTVKTKAVKETVTKTRKRGKSVPPKAKLNVETALPPLPQKSQVGSSAISTLTSRKFFKHKSPGSASKVAGGIIIQQGFNLKFVPGSVKKQSLSPIGKKKVKAEATSIRKSPKTYSRSRVPKSGSQSDSVLTLSDIASSSHNGPELKTDSSPSLSSHTVGSNSQTSQSFPSSDTQSLASDVSGPTVRSINKASTPQSALSRSMTRSESNISMPESDMSEPESSMSAPDTSASDMCGPTPGSSASSEGRGAGGRFYSIFSKRQRNKLAESSPSQDKLASPKDLPMTRKWITTKEDDKQLMLDAGQERFGATQCKECGMVYSPGDHRDETDHAKFHQSALAALKFSRWKKERVIKDFLDDGSRVIVVLPDDHRFMLKKVEDVNKVMGQELGIPDHAFRFHPSYKAFLYVSDEKRVEGCCIAETITKGYRILPTTKDLEEGQRPWLCSSQPEPASVGIGRLWVYGPSRQRGIASRLLDCVRQWFEYGIVLDKNQLAFSDPTPDGRMFAAKYTGSVNFLVYKYNPN